MIARAALPPCDLVQFIDGDCELAPGWLALAADLLAAFVNPKLRRA